MGIGSITFSLPHFLSDNYMVHSDLNSTNDNICRAPRLSQAKSGVDLIPGLDKIQSLTEGGCDHEANFGLMPYFFVQIIMSKLAGDDNLLNREREREKAKVIED